MEREEKNLINLVKPKFSIDKYLFQLIDYKTIGIIYNSQVLDYINLSDYFDILNNYSAKNLVIKPKEIKKVDGDDVALYGEKKQILYIEKNLLDENVYKIVYKVDCNYNNYTKESEYSFISLNENDNIINDIKDNFLNNPSSIVKKYLTITEDNKKIYFKSLIAGNLNIIKFLLIDRQYYLNNINNNIDKINELFSKEEFNQEEKDNIIVLNTKIQENHLKYPNGAFKIIFAYIDYNYFNEKNEKIIPLKYLYNNEIINENFNWKKVGKILLLSGMDDIDENDNNLIDTIWLKNDNNFPVMVKIIIGS